MQMAPEMFWENNGPQVSQSFKNNAGLEKSYQYLLKEKTIDERWAINSYSQNTSAHRKQLLVEIIAKPGINLNSDNLKVFA